MQVLSSITHVALFDLAESLRSKKALALLILYLLGSIAAAVLFVALLTQVEETVASEILAVASSDKPGVLSESLMESEQVLQMVTGLVGDPALAAELLSIPLLALFYGWLSLTFLPLFAALISADTISAHLADGSCRFVLFRIDRLSWALGTFFGQAMLMFGGIVLAGVGVWIVGFIGLNSFEPVETAWWIARLGLRTQTYGMAFLGMVIGASQMTRSVNGSQAMALLGLFGLGVGGAVTGSAWIQEWGTQWGSFVPVIAQSVHTLFPNAHRLTLWQPDLWTRLPGMLILMCLSVVYFSIGHRFLHKADT